MKTFYLVLLLALLSGCGSERRNEIIYLYPKDKSQVISIISDYSKNQRIIAVGKHKSKPKRNYFLLDISKVTNLGDEIGICWKINDDGWEIANEKANILDSNIDTTKYVFRGYWFKDRTGAPNTLYYIKENCLTLETLNYTKFYPEENGVVERFY